MDRFEIRELDAAGAAELADAFSEGGWNKPRSQFTSYLQKHESGEILCLVAFVEGQVAGYLNVVWIPDYQPLRELGTPEIQDLNVMDRFRRRGIASRLLDRAEREVARRSSKVGIGVGLHPGYNAAQRLYVLRGYVPDARGMSYKDEFLAEGAIVTLDDDLVLHFTKDLISTQHAIRVISLCVIRRDDSILVFEAFDTVQASPFYRPLGGGVLPGETSQHAVVREIQEEINLEVGELQLLGTLENIFTYEGRPGHEIAFVYEARFKDESAYGIENFVVTEDSGETIPAKWIPLSFFNEYHRLVPEGLMSLLITETP